MSAARSHLTVSVTVDAPDRLILKNWEDNDFLVQQIRVDYYFHDGGWTRRRIKATGKRIEKDGSVGAVSAHSSWGQEFSPEVRRQLQVAAESIIKAAARSVMSP